MGICKGLWNGALSLPLPLSCTWIHFLIGLVAGVMPRAGIMIALLFLLYQLTEPIVLGYVDNVPTDLGEFLAGYLTGLAGRMLLLLLLLSLSLSVSLSVSVTKPSFLLAGTGMSGPRGV